MPERKQPYIGVSGVVNPGQQRELLAMADFHDLQRTGRRLMLGVKAVHKTQYLDIENKYGPMWYPVGEQALDTALAHDNFMSYNVAQLYMDPDYASSHPGYFEEFVRRVKWRGRNVLDALQFDMLPYIDNPEALRPVVRTTKEDGMEIIVQCYGAAMTEGHRTALDKLKRLAGDDTLDYVLFDASHGTGKEMDSSTLAGFLEAAYTDADFAYAGTNFGVAGGLDADTVRRHLSGLLADFPELSWDAEGRLHQGTVDKSLNMDVVEEYIAASVEATERGGE